MPKIVLEFSEEMAKVITDLAKDVGTTKEEVLRRAVAIYRFLNEETASNPNRHVLLSDSNTEIKNPKELKVR